MPTMRASCSSLGVINIVLSNFPALFCNLREGLCMYECVIARGIRARGFSRGFVKVRESRCFSCFIAKKIRYEVT